jgi:hypothetical protein
MKKAEGRLAAQHKYSPSLQEKRFGESSPFPSVDFKSGKLFGTDNPKEAEITNDCLNIGFSIWKHLKLIFWRK